MVSDACIVNSASDLLVLRMKLIFLEIEVNFSDQLLNFDLKFLNFNVGTVAEKLQMMMNFLNAYK